MGIVRQGFHAERIPATSANVRSGLAFGCVRTNGSKSMVIQVGKMNSILEMKTEEEYKAQKRKHRFEEKDGKSVVICELKCCCLEAHGNGLQ